MSKFTDSGDIPNIILHEVGVHKIKGLVSAGLGISVTWESCTGEGYAGIVYRQVHDGSGPSHVSFTAHWRKSNQNPALESFLDILRERYPDFSSPLASATFAKAAV